MPYLLCRNRVQDLVAWTAIFTSHKDAHGAAGLTLLNIWPSQQDSNNLFLLFQVSSMSGAEAFIHDSENIRIGEVAGVLDGEYHFLAESFSY